MSKCTWCTRDTQETCPECGGTGYKLPNTAPSTPIDKDLRTKIQPFCDAILRQGAELYKDKQFFSGRKEVDEQLDHIMRAFNSHLRSILDEVIGPMEDVPGTRKDPMEFTPKEMSALDRNTLRHKQLEIAAKYIPVSKSR